MRDMRYELDALKRDHQDEVDRLNQRMTATEHDVSDLYVA